MQLTSTLDMPREKWLELRKEGIGGSDAAVIMGVNPWKSPLELWLEKTGELADDEDNEAMYWGRMLEDMVAREFAKRTGKQVRRKNSLIKSKKHPFMLANIDRDVVGERAGLECKTTSGFYEDTGECPAHYYPQIQHYMAVLGYEKWYVAVLAGGQRFYIYEVPRNEAYIDEMISKERQFWDLVLSDTPPVADSGSNDALAKMFPTAKDDEDVVELPGEAFELIIQYDRAHDAEKQAKEAKDEAANRLKQMLADNAKGVIFDRTVRWTNVNRNNFDRRRFQKERPELYDQYVNSSSYRRFSVS